MDSTRGKSQRRNLESLQILGKHTALYHVYGLNIGDGMYMRKDAEGILNAGPDVIGDQDKGELYFVPKDEKGQLLMDKMVSAGEGYKLVRENPDGTIKHVSGNISTHGALLSNSGDALEQARDHLKRLVEYLVEHK